jgi:hypothetical protein
MFATAVHVCSCGLIFGGRMQMVVGANDGRTETNRFARTLPMIRSREKTYRHGPMAARPAIPPSPARGAISQKRVAGGYSTWPIEACIRKRK